MRHAQTLNEAQFRKVLHYCRTTRHANRDTAIFMVSFFAGLRAKEIAALKLGDVFDAEGRVREQFTLESDQTKGGQRRSVFINKRLAKALDDYGLDKNLSMCTDTTLQVLRRIEVPPTVKVCIINLGCKLRSQAQAQSTLAKF